MLFDNNDIAYKNGTSATVGLGTWLLLYAIQLLNLIPVVGNIVAIVVYVLIAARRDNAPSIQNYIIASLIWAVIWLVVALVAVLLVYAGVLHLSGLLASAAVAVA